MNSASTFFLALSDFSETLSNRNRKRNEIKIPDAPFDAPEIANLGPHEVFILGDA